MSAATKSNKPKKRKRPLLTKKQAAFAKELANPENHSIKEAAIKAGYAESTALKDVHRHLDNPLFNEAVDDIRARNRALLERVGAGELKRFKKISQLMGAQAVVTASIGGKITDIKRFADGALQLAATKEALKLAGDYPADQAEVTHKGGVLLLSVKDDPLSAAFDITPSEE